MKLFLYRLWQWSWGLPQSLLGAVIALIFRKCPHAWYQGSYVTVWPLRSSMSLGMFLFLRQSWTPQEKALLTHEYGHTVQSLLLGPLYLLVIGLPSFLWAGFAPLVRLRKRKKLPYSWLYTERWADRCGAKFAKKDLSL